MFKLKLYQADLHYQKGIVLHTASSGAVPALSELYLTAQKGDEVIAIGEARENISYLTGHSADEVRSAVTGICTALDWALPPEDILNQLHDMPHPVSSAPALIDCCLHDLIARNHNQQVCELLGGRATESSSTNQTLFWSPDAEFRELAGNYVRRGFKTLKLRVGIGSFEEDMERLQFLRTSFGADAKLSIDANGTWTTDQAIENLRRLAPLDLDYAEQPIPPGNWDAMIKLAEAAPMPVFADESASTRDDIQTIASLGGRVGAHLKIAKMGGIRPVFTAARQLMEAGAPVMIGQMNEGAAATAAAAHLSIALGVTHRELYGADGLLNDPAEGLRYDDGKLWLSGNSGLGITLETDNLTLLWES